MKLVKLLLALILLLVIGGILYLGLSTAQVEQKPVTVDYKGSGITQSPTQPSAQTPTASPLPPQPQPLTQPQAAPTQAQPLTPMPGESPASTVAPAPGTAPSAKGPDE